MNTGLGWGGGPVELSDDELDASVESEAIELVDSLEGTDVVTVWVVVVPSDVPLVRVAGAGCVVCSPDVEEPPSTTHRPASPSPANSAYRRPVPHSASGKEQYPVASQVPIPALETQASSSPHT